MMQTCEEKWLWGGGRAVWELWIRPIAQLAVFETEGDLDHALLRYCQFLDLMRAWMVSTSESKVHHG
jgi:hypothetical protein